MSGKLSFLDGAFFLLPIILYHDGGGGGGGGGGGIRKKSNMHAHISPYFYVLALKCLLMKEGDCWVCWTGLTSGSCLPVLGH